MDISLPKGTYVVAVSGGVDSMTLLDLLAKQPELKLIVAHFDHGIRSDSELDRQLVAQAAKNYGLPFVFDTAQLGPQASEAAARTARYNFLKRVRSAANARAIVTAHHQDDVLETAIFNVLRGTGRKGLTSLKSRSGLHRPLLDVAKWQILDYALANNLQWREDTTNQDTRYRRNFIRSQIMPKLTYQHRKQLLEHIKQQHKLELEIEHLLANQLHQQPASGVLNRYWFIMLPHVVAKETLTQWLRAHGLQAFDARAIERLVVAGKTAVPGKVVDIYGPVKLAVSQDKLALTGLER